MISKHVRLLTLLATFGVAACGVSSDVIVPGDLTDTEAQDMAGAMLVATFQSSAAAPEQQSGPAGVEYEYARAFETVVPCGLGGAVAVAAEVNVSADTETETLHVQWGMTQTHNGCVVQSEDGREFTLWGNPDLSFAFVVEADGIGDVVAWEGHVEGNVDWQTDGREGTCAIAFEFGGSLEGTSDRVAGNMGGTVCGVQFSRAFSIGMGAPGT